MTDKQMRTVTAAQMRDLEHFTIDRLGMPGIVLMERAALACMERLCRGDFDLGSSVCLCGTGNNGGDGMAIARLLHLAGHAASIVLVGDVDRLSMDATQQLAIAENYGVPLTCYSPGALTGALPDAQTNDQPTTIVDAVFGIGLSRPVEGVQLAAIEEANALARTGCKILSVDIPSGICTDSGDVLGAAVNATATVTFAFNKRGLICGAGKKAAGELAVADIGIYDFDEGQAACTELPSEANEAIAGIAAGIAPIANHLNGIAAGVVSDYEPIVNAIVEGKITDRDEINHTLGWMLEYSYNEQMRNLLLTACRSLVTKYPEIVASHLQSYQQLYG